MTHKITLIVPFKLADDNNYGVENDMRVMAANESYMICNLFISGPKNKILLCYINEFYFVNTNLSPCKPGNQFSNSFIFMIL